LWLQSVELAISRVADRVRMGGHAIPEEVIRRRYIGGLKNFFNLYLPIADYWQFYDNSYDDSSLIAIKSQHETM
jgi:predicted ABC-type ATPase